MRKNKLIDVSDVITKGTTPTTVGEEFTSEGIKFIKSESISGSKYLDESLYDHISYETDEKLKRSRLKENDLLFSIAGAYLGKIAIVRKEDLPSNTNQAVGIVRINREKADVDYLYYYFSQTHINKYINTLSSQSSQPNLNLDLLGKLEYEDIPIKRQKKISKVLSLLDDKIENNKRINTELERVVKTIYDYWFLQFDFPNKEGKPYKSSGGKMAWNEELKCEIPEGWESKKLSEISKMAMNTVLPQENTLYRHYSIPAFDDGKVPILEQGKNIASNKYIVPNDAILVSKLNPQFKRIWLIEKEVGDGICSTEFIPFVSVFDNKEFLYLLLNSDGFYKFMVQSSSSSTGSRKRMQPELMGEYKLAYPQDENILSVFKNMIQPNLEKMIRIREENQELIALRDFLLPLLMNGQVGFKEE